MNAAHRLRDIELEIRADNFAQAACLGHDLVAPLLSRWVFLHDVAITTSAVQIVEATSQVHQWSQLVLGAVKAFSDTSGASDPSRRSCGVGQVLIPHADEAFGGDLMTPPPATARRPGHSKDHLGTSRADLGTFACGAPQAFRRSIIADTCGAVPRP